MSRNFSRRWTAIIKGGACFFRQEPEAVPPNREHGFIRAHLGRWPAAVMCRALGVSEQGYYRSLRRLEKGRYDRRLLQQIYACLREGEGNGDNYGVRRIIAWLRLHRGYTGGSRRIYGICHEHGLVIRPKHSSNGVTKAERQAGKSENLIKRDFTASKLNTKLLTDITEIPCCGGKLYLAAVLDCFDGSIQGFHMDDNMRAELCEQALKNVCRSNGVAGAIIHSDRGSQFTGHTFRAALACHKLIRSMSGAGRRYDNARMESFFDTLKKEKLYRIDTAMMEREEVKSVVFRYIHYYNLRRISSITGGLPPLVFRERFMRSTCQEAA